MFDEVDYEAMLSFQDAITTDGERWRERTTPFFE
jgi:hypothetical protein